jgi:multiple sugar transport system ATP-binding protein
VYVPHDQIEAMTMADKIVVLRDGVVEQIGAPLDLYDRPANLFVATFIGSPSMNILDGEIVKDGAGVVFQMTDGKVKLPLPANPALTPGRKVKYGVRPEHFTLSDSGMRAEVVLTEPTGSETQVFMRLGGHDVLGVFRERVSVARGDTVGISIQQGAMHVFDAQTQQRIVA